MAVCGGSGSGQVAPRGCSGHADGGGHVARCATHRAFASFGRPVHGGSASCLPCRPLLLSPMLHLCLRPLLASRCRHCARHCPRAATRPMQQRGRSVWWQGRRARWQHPAAVEQHARSVRHLAVLMAGHAHVLAVARARSGAWSCSSHTHACVWWPCHCLCCRAVLSRPLWLQCNIVPAPAVRCLIVPRGACAHGMDIVLPPGSAPAGAKDGKADNPKGTTGRVPRGKNGMRFSKIRQPSTTTSTGESAWHGRGGVLRGRVGARARVCVGVVVLDGRGTR